MSLRVASHAMRTNNTITSQVKTIVALREKDPNFQYRFVNDIGSRIHQMKEAGYEFVTDDDMVVGEARVSDPTSQGSAKRVVSKDGTVSFLMRQKKEWFDEDQKAKQDRVDELEQSMKNEASQGMYGSIKIDRK